MSEPHTVCEELCSRSVCSYKGSNEPDCFAKLPKVQKHFHNLVATSPAKLRPGESSTPFSKDFVWVKTDILGSGAFGTVHRCRNRGDNLYRYAVKELLLSATPHGINSITAVLQEVEVMQALLRAGTCHIVKLHAFYRSQDTAWLVLELLPGQPLDKVLGMLYKLPADDRRAIFTRTATELLQMLADVHAKGIAHGDLKPANIFLHLQSCQTMTHVLDWGLAKRYQPGEKHVLLQGTLEYLAPEILDQWTAQSQGREPAPCDPASADMWSMGVVLFEVYTCKNPFRAGWWRLATMQQARGIRALQQQWANRASGMAKMQQLLLKLPSSAVGLFQGLLDENPERRLRAEQALEHPFFSRRGQH